MMELKNIHVSFKTECRDTFFSSKQKQVLKNVNFQVKKGTCLGILGESGSGKSTLGRVICGLLKPTKGEVFIDHFSIYESIKNKRYLQQQISVVFQDYSSSANPRFCVGDIIAEGIMLYERKGRTKENRTEEIKRFMKLVGLHENLINRYPHELSGGQLQRVCIARSIASQPKLILFDEAISSLDAHTQVQIMDLLKQLKQELNLTYLFITHDVTSVTYMCDEVLFLYQGHMVEQIEVENIADVKQEYSRKLLEAVIEF